jgi:hypothetical protein
MTYSPWPLYTVSSHEEVEYSTYDILWDVSEDDRCTSNFGGFATGWQNGTSALQTCSIRGSGLQIQILGRLATRLLSTLATQVVRFRMTYRVADDASIGSSLHLSCVYVC